MDGLKSRVASSLRFRLALWLSVAVVAVAACAGAVLFGVTLEEAHAMQDNQLRQTGYLISRLDAAPAAPMAREQPGDVDYDARVVVRFLREPGGPVPEPPPRPPEFSSTLVDGLQTVYVGAERWRVFVRTNAKKVRVAVGQQTSIRDAAARANALRAVTPILFLAPLLVLLVMILVERMFRPLHRLAAELERRQEHDLSQLSSAPLPSEVWPLVAQINALLLRTGRTLALQSRFIADAAHELRSPMTAMSLQAERLGATAMPAEARARLSALASGLGRTRALLEQLLTLARMHEPTLAPTQQAPLEQVIREVLELLVPLAEEKQVDLGAVGDMAAMVAGTSFDVKVLVKNLIDNAIRYTPIGGRVDLTVTRTRDCIALQIDDTGPGIALTQRSRVFDPFYRVLGNGEIGSGLGLAIAAAAAANIGARIELDTAAGGGLRVIVFFTAASPASR